MSRRKIFLLGAIGLLALGLLVLIACDRAANRNNIGTAEIVEPLNYGNGVYYFPVITATFGNSLSVFIERHKDDLELVTIAENGTGIYGANEGYFAVFRPKK